MVVIHSTSVTSAAPIDTAKPLIATKTSGSAFTLPLPDKVDPASRTQPLAVANTSFFSAVVRFFGFDSSASDAPQSAMFFSLR